MMKKRLYIPIFGFIITTASVALALWPMDPMPDPISEQAPVNQWPKSNSFTPNSAYPLIKISHLDMAPVDWFPDLASAATVTVTKGGQWSGIFPRGSLDADDIILIPAGVMVEYDVPGGTGIMAIVVKGTLRFSDAMDTKMTVGTIMVYPGGKLDIGSADAGIISELIFSGAVDTAKDPAQALLGLIALGGTVTIEGARIETPFARTAAANGERTAGANGVAAAGPIKPDPTDWRYHGTSERTLSFAETRQDALMESGYTANMARNVILRSVRAAGTGNGRRAHILLTGKTRATVRNTAIIGLGRTTVEQTGDASFSDTGVFTHEGANQRGRYPLHAHHLEMPFVFDGNVIDGSPKWGIVNHGSFGSIKNNIVAGAAGAGIVGEDGVESGLVAGNLVIGTGGGSGLPDDERFGPSKGRDMAHGGYGYWFRGPFMDIRDNVAVGYFPEAAYSFFVHPGFARTMMPEVPGMPADLHGKSANDLIAKSPIRLFSGNKAVGYFGDDGFSLFYSLVPQTIERFELEMLGASSSARGIFLRHSVALEVMDSTLSAAGAGTAIESSPTPGLITASNTSIKGFRK